MDNILPGNTMLHFSRGIIEEISSDRNNLLVTVSYSQCANCNRRDQRIRLVVGNNTAISMNQEEESRRETYEQVW